MADVLLRNPAYPQLAGLAAAYGHVEVGATLTLVERGVTLTVTVAIDSGCVVGFDVQAEARAFPEITLSREGDFHRLGKAVRLDVEPQIGDPEFDRLVYVATLVDEAAARAMFAAPAARGAVRWLLDQHVQRVELGPRGLSLRIPESTLEPARFREYGAAIAALIGALPALAPTPKPRRGYGGVYALGVVALAWVATGIYVFGHAVGTYQTLENTPYWLGFVVHAGVFVLLAALTWLVVRGRPRSSIAFLIVLGIFGFGSAYHAIGDLIWLDAALDPSAAQEREFRILDREDDEDSVLLTLEPTTPPRGVVTVRFRRAVAETDRITLETHPGWLGWEWTRARP